MKARLVLLLLIAILVSVGTAVWWKRNSTRQPSLERDSRVRSARRAYDGAPPVIPHPRLGGACIHCHAAPGRELPGIGWAAAHPHGQTPGMSDSSRCEQCHVFLRSDALLVASDFEPLAQDFRKGDRLYSTAPPPVPHAYFLREDCVACHVGQGARPEIRCSHPDRLHCLQCHALGQ